MNIVIVQRIVCVCGIVSVCVCVCVCGIVSVSIDVWFVVLGVVYL